MEDQNTAVTENPVHKMAAPLFLITSIPYFAAMGYGYFSCCETDDTFAWFGLFYLGIGGYYLAKRFLSK